MACKHKCSWAGVVPMLYALSRWWRDRQRLRFRASIVRPDHTARAALLLVAVALPAWVLMVILADIGLI